MIFRCMFTFSTLYICFTCKALEPVEISGTWESGSRAIYTVFGTIEVSESHIRWGQDIKDFACETEYSKVEQFKTPNYPDNHVSPGEYVDHYYVVKLKLINLSCNYRKIGNKQIHSNLGFMQFSVPIESDLDGFLVDYYTVGFNTYNLAGKPMGWGLVSRK